MKTKILSLTLIVTLMLSVLSVSATEIEVVNFNTADSRTCRNEISDIIIAVTAKDESKIQSHVAEFTSECYEDIRQYTISEKNDINSSVISELVADYVTPSNSTTGDTVIMANCKIIYNEPQYNKLYLFEFHVNKEGKIYGYNVWVY